MKKYFELEIPTRYTGKYIKCSGMFWKCPTNSFWKFGSDLGLFNLK